MFWIALWARSASTYIANCIDRHHIDWFHALAIAALMQPSWHKRELLAMHKMHKCIEMHWITWSKRYSCNAALAQCSYSLLRGEWLNPTNLSVRSTLKWKSGSWKKLVPGQKSRRTTSCGIDCTSCLRAICETTFSCFFSKPFKYQLLLDWQSTICTTLKLEKKRLHCFSLKSPTLVEVQNHSDDESP